MILNKKMQTALNNQINAELDSAYIYLSMAAYFEGQNWPGMAHWMKQQYLEEVEHAMKIFDYVFERGGQVTLKTIDSPQSSWTSPLDAFKTALKHEQHISQLIYNLVDVADNGFA